MRTRFGDCLLDSETRQFFVAGEEVHLQPKAFQFLELLLQNRPKALAKSAIHEKLWPGTFVSDGTLTSLLAELRDAIGDTARNPRFVRTVHRFGYAFCGEAAATRESPPGAGAARLAYWLVRGRRRYALATGESIIGRDPGAAVFLDDASVSRRHARIVVSDAGATLEDQSSIRIGSMSLTIRIFPMSDSTQTAAEHKR